MGNLANWFIHGDWDMEWLQEQLGQWSSTLAGACFGAAWWFFIDAHVQARIVEGAAPPFKYYWPGIIATIALILINLVPRRELREIAESGEDGENLRARLWLLFSFLLAFGAVAGSVAVLISCTQANKFVAVGAGSVVQSGLTLVSALLFWAFRSPEGVEGYNYI